LTLSLFRRIWPDATCRRIGPVTIDMGAWKSCGEDVDWIVAARADNDTGRGGRGRCRERHLVSLTQEAEE
jgi:hypothetical protein